MTAAARNAPKRSSRPRHDGGPPRNASMIPAARLAAAIEVFADIDARRRPAADVLKDWGLGHRFAGSSDRAAIAGLVYDALRRKASSAWVMGEASPRAALLGMLRSERGHDLAAIRALCSGARFAPAPLTEAEEAALASNLLAGCAGLYPGRLSGMARPVLGARLGRGARGRGRGAGEPGAARSARQHAEGRARRTATRSQPSWRRTDAVVADRAAHPACRRCQKPRDPR